MEIEITIEEDPTIIIHNIERDHVSFLRFSQFSNIPFTGGGGGGDGYYDNSYGRGRRPYPDHNRGRGGFRGKKILFNEIII